MGPIRIIPVVATAALGLALAQPAAAGADPLTGRALVLLQDRRGGPAHASAARALLARTGARRAGLSVPEIGLVTVALPQGRSFSSFASALRADPSVKSVQPEHRATLRDVPNDPAVSAAEPTAAGVTVQWAPARQGMYRAWDVTHGDGALVADIDTGVDGGHPDINGKIAAAVDQDLNPNDGPATVDEVGHGTHVASLACGGTNNGTGMSGIGYNCRLIVEKSDLSDSSIAASIVDATNRGAQAINMSFGDDGSRPPVDAWVRAIDYAYARHVVLVAAAADDAVNEQGQPANLLQPSGSAADINQGKGLSVTSATYFDGNSGAGFGSQISLAAYGSYKRFGASDPGPKGLFGAFPSNVTDLELPSLDPPSTGCGCRTSFNGDNRYAYVQGTSMAAPQVAAVAALMRTVNPDLASGDIIKLIKQTGRRPGGGWTSELGWGILDGGAAVVAARSLDRRAPTSRLSAPSRSTKRAITLRWTGRDTAAPGVAVAGIRYFDVYAAQNRRAAKRIARTSALSMRFKAALGSTYRFYTIAVDRAGNREVKRSRADATTRVARARR
ncbi:MAG: serine protease [Solirubrobacteraceae bacterium]|nr:serine protease [Solirubrobacteraceae bacterium]